MGSRFFLNQPMIVLGREAGCDIVLDHESISRRHVRIDKEKSGPLTASDLSSTNGSFVNDKPANSTPLNNGDYLRVGACLFRFLGEGNVEADYHEVIYNLTILDPLTGCGNKRYFHETLEKEVARSNRYKRPLSLVIADLDHFKKVNDSMGHLTGDATLKSFALLARNCIRSEEVLCRFGGEEFAIICPETTMENALVVAERIRTRLAVYTMEHGGNKFSQTASFGVASMIGNPPFTADQLIQAADQKLYLAKNSGRNKTMG